VNEERFVAERTPRWTELRALLSRAQSRGLASLSGDEVRRLGALYRAATTDLAAARSFRLSEATVLHVNRLCVAAHGLIYAGHGGGGALRRAASFLGGGFAALVRRTWRHHAFAAAAMAVPGIAAFLVFRGDPDLAERTLGTVFRDRAERAAAMPDDARRYIEVSAMWMPLMSWGIMANNIFVSLAGFAAGAVGCVGGVWLLAKNGVSLGGGFAAFHDAGVPGVLWTFIAAHGPLELTAIAISCGAGLRLGLSLVVPGRRSRAAAFRETGLESVTLLLGAAAMLVVAGLLEGFLSPSDAPAPAKWTVGAATAVGMAWYCARAGGDARRERTTGGPASDPARLPA
jgi:uncharacterized membrane protein SpoIIM required for sporulation